MRDKLTARPDTILDAINAAQEAKYPYSRKWNLSAAHGTYLSKDEWDRHRTALINKLLLVYEGVRHDYA